MQYTDFVCLANSRKPGGRCVAGIRLSGDWIRPVSTEPDGTLCPPHYRLKDGSEPALLDIVRLEASPSPEPHQPENWQIGPAPWRRIGRLLPADAKDLLRYRAVQGPGLLANQRDYVPLKDLAAHPGQPSLCMVEAVQLRWRIATSGRGRKTRAIFALAGVEYDLSVTDPVWEEHLNNLADGIRARQAAEVSEDQAIFLTVSRASPWNGSCYKVIAAVIVL